MDVKMETLLLSYLPKVRKLLNDRAEVLELEWYVF